MNRKFTLILMAAALIGVAGFLYLRGGLVPNPQLRPNESTAPLVDNLTKSDQPPWKKTSMVTSWKKT